MCQLDPKAHVRRRFGTRSDFKLRFADHIPLLFYHHVVSGRLNGQQGVKANGDCQRSLRCLAQSAY